MDKASRGSLENIKVIDLSRLLPGPLCSMILADHGADVLSMEDRRFEKENHFVRPLYRNKKHMTLNLKQDQGRQIFLDLARDTDVIIEGFRPGVAEKLGVAYKDILPVNPGVIYCSISGFGQTGAFKDKPGHDVNYLGLTGLLDLMGAKDGPPSIPGIQTADITGALTAVTGILLALFHRQKTGQGQYIDISITDSLACFFPVLEFFRSITGFFPARSDSMLSHRYACYNTYETKDKKSIAVGAVEHVFWKKICLKLDLSDLIPLQYDEFHRKEVLEKLKKTFRSQPLAFWEETFKDLDACVTPVKTLDEAIQTPLFKERKILFKDDAGNLSPGIPVKLEKTPGSVKSLPVSFGQNTRQILESLGFDKDRVRELKDKGII
ncbi:MAG: carnitine dehydratase [Desulfobacula sp. GWF2_41_7]|nr:MAG: carnitine dehydratase [Desulfobacula sp. GWF2_41_7]